jgi:hypothetical protein
VCGKHPFGDQLLFLNVFITLPLKVLQKVFLVLLLRHSLVVLSLFSPLSSRYEEVRRRNIDGVKKGRLLTFCRKRRGTDPEMTVLRQTSYRAAEGLTKYAPPHMFVS